MKMSRLLVAINIIFKYSYNTGHVYSVCVTTFLFLKMKIQLNFHCIEYFDFHKSQIAYSGSAYVWFRELLAFDHFKGKVNRFQYV